jgi:hypothetical protein
MYLNGSNAVISNQETGSLAFETSGLTRATLDSSGNLGLGVTPSANAGLRTLYVAGYNGGYSAIALGASGGGYGCVGYNLGFTGADGQIKALASDGMSWLRFQNGAFQFFQQTSATAGTTYTGTQAMTLDASGNLLLSTTSTGGYSGFIMGSGKLIISPGTYNNTTATAGNMGVAADGAFYRSTSALKYKQDIRDVEDFDISVLRPVRYKSKCDGDDQTKDHLGLIADEAAEAGFEELVTRGVNGEVEGFQYERLTVVLLKKLQTLTDRVAELEAK